jgi:hypothetical protein
MNLNAIIAFALLRVTISTYRSLCRRCISVVDPSVRTGVPLAAASLLLRTCSRKVSAMSRLRGGARGACVCAFRGLRGSRAFAHGEGARWGERRGAGAGARGARAAGRGAGAGCGARGAGRSALPAGRRAAGRPRAVCGRFSRRRRSLDIVPVSPLDQDVPPEVQKVDRCASVRHPRRAAPGRPPPPRGRASAPATGRARARGRGREPAACRGPGAPRRSLRRPRRRVARGLGRWLASSVARQAQTRRRRTQRRGRPPPLVLLLRPMLRDVTA